jgi:hypothetical protein
VMSEAKVSGTENTSPEDKDKNSPRTASKHFSDLQGDWIIESFYFDEDTNSRELQKQVPGPITLGALRIDDNQLLLRGPSVAGMTRTAAGFSLKPVEGNACGRFVIVDEPETQVLKDEPLRFGMYKVVGDKLTILMTNAKPPKTLAPQERGWYYEAHRAVSVEDHATLEAIERTPAEHDQLKLRHSIDTEKVPDAAKPIQAILHGDQ